MRRKIQGLCVIAHKSNNEDCMYTLYNGCFDQLVPRVEPIANGRYITKHEASLKTEPIKQNPVKI